MLALAALLTATGMGCLAAITRRRHHPRVFLRVALPGLLTLGVLGLSTSITNQAAQAATCAPISIGGIQVSTFCPRPQPQIDRLPTFKPQTVIQPTITGQITGTLATTKTNNQFLPLDPNHLYQHATTGQTTSKLATTISHVTPANPKPLYKPATTGQTTGTLAANPTKSDPHQAGRCTKDCPANPPSCGANQKVCTPNLHQPTCGTTSTSHANNCAPAPAGKKGKDKGSLVTGRPIRTRPTTHAAATGHGLRPSTRPSKSSRS